MQNNVTKLYKVYEECFDYLNSFYKNSFNILSDIILLVCTDEDIVNDVGAKKNINYQGRLNLIEKRYDNKFFFNEYYFDRTLNNCFKYVIEKFSPFVNEQYNIVEFETFLGNVLERHVNRKKTGSYYTPEDTTEYIVNKAVIALLLSFLKELGIEKKEYSQYLNSNLSVIEFVSYLKKEESKPILDLLLLKLSNSKCIDPTCGSGAFISKLFDVFIQLFAILDESMSLSEATNIIIKIMHGVDISQEALTFTKMRLLLKFITFGELPHDFVKHFNENFLCENSLKGNDYVINEYNDGFDWKNFNYRFDLIVGNPPYIETKQDKMNHFISKKCGNLYAYTIERSINIANEKAIIAFIVPLAFITTPRMNIIRSYLEERSEYVYYSTYADRPSCLFKGVHQRLTIFFSFLNKSDNYKCQIYSSAHNFWYQDEREFLFKRINYFKNEFTDTYLKLGNSKDEKIIIKMLETKKSISSYLKRDSDYFLFLSTRIGFWGKCFLSKPSSKEYKKLNFESEEIRNILNCFFNSSTFYYYWLISSDCWHITGKNLDFIKFDISKLSLQNKSELIRLSKLLMEDLEMNKVFVKTKQTDYEYKHKLSKPIIDSIDDILASVYGFNKLELYYIKQFAIKYR